MKRTAQKKPDFVQSLKRQSTLFLPSVSCCLGWMEYMELLRFSFHGIDPDSHRNARMLLNWDYGIECKK